MSEKTKTQATEDLIGRICAAPIKLLPQWYWGAASLSAVGLGIANHNEVIDSPVWMSSAVLWAPFTPILVALGTIFTIVVTLGMLLGVAFMIRAIWEAVYALAMFTANRLFFWRKKPTESVTDMASKMGNVGL